MNIEEWFGLTGKNAVIFGGGQGIGESCALSLAKAGCNVAVLDFDDVRAKDVAAQARKYGGRSCAIHCDILDDDSITSAMRESGDQLGELDVIVTVVGRAQYTPSLDLTGAEWDLDHRRNLRYTFVAAREFANIQVRKKRAGVIIAISSVSGLQSAPQHVAYGAAKAGLVNLVKSLAVEWAQHSIRVNGIAPGSIATPSRPDTDEWRERVGKSLIPMKRRGHVDEVGNAVVFLASAMATYVTGHTLAVDGGWMAANVFVRPEDDMRFKDKLPPSAQT